MIFGAAREHSDAGCWSGHPEMVNVTPLLTIRAAPR